MTIEEAIKHCEEVEEKQEALANTFKSFKDYGNPKSSITSGYEKCKKCASEHRQLAEWLKELKKLRKFAHYVAYSITAEEEEFNENPRFFGESYCRKLHKLGIIKMVDNKWVYDEEVNADV